MSATEKKKNDDKDPSRRAGEETVSVPHDEYEKLQKQAQELSEMRDRLLRTAADFENTKKRLVREQEQFARFSQEKILREMLPVLDNLERALAHAGETQDEKTRAMLAGIQLVFKQLSETLKAQGLTRLKTVGEKFDPHRHEAVAHAPGPGPEDVVVEEMEPGYMLHDRLLRAAKVKVRVSPDRASSSVHSDEDEDLT